MFDKDLYKILGVQKGASQGEIRKAFHKHAKKYHPDVNAGDKAAETKFKEVNLAYEVLKDKKKRAQYDQMRAAGQNPFSGHHAGGQPFGPEAFGDFGLGDLFEEIFGGGGFGRPMGGRARYQRQPFAQRGADREAELTISFLEAARGVEKALDLGRGKRVTVKIPEGVEDHSKIKLSGQGERGLGGGPNGDLILRLKVLASPDFRREGANVLIDLPITFSEAVLGTEVEVPTLDGSVHLKVPPGVSSGQRLKLKGKGIRQTGRSQRGDQFASILIKIPKKPDKDYQAAAEKLSESKFSART